jgi:hypothetical protein
MFLNIYIMKKLAVIALIILSAKISMAQNYMTKEGMIDIYSETPIFTIDGKTQSAGSILNTSTGEIAASVLITSFKFKEALLEEHFNENYMESHKFPKAQYKGKITNWSTIDITKDGTYPVTLDGTMIIHGVTKATTTQGTLTVTGGKLVANAEFLVTIADYGIEVEESYKDRIPEKMKITLQFNYAKM